MCQRPGDVAAVPVVLLPGDDARERLLRVRSRRAPRSKRSPPRGSPRGAVLATTKEKNERRSEVSRKHSHPDPHQLVFAQERDELPSRKRRPRKGPPGPCPRCAPQCHRCRGVSDAAVSGWRVAVRSWVRVAWSAQSAPSPRRTIREPDQRALFDASKRRTPQRRLSPNARRTTRWQMRSPLLRGRTVSSAKDQSQTRRRSS